MSSGLRRVSAGRSRGAPARMAGESAAPRRGPAGVDDLRAPRSAGKGSPDPGTRKPDSRPQRTRKAVSGQERRRRRWHGRNPPGQPRRDGAGRAVGRRCGLLLRPGIEDVGSVEADPSATPRLPSRGTGVRSAMRAAPLDQAPPAAGGSSGPWASCPPDIAGLNRPPPNPPATIRPACTPAIARQWLSQLR